MRCSPLMVRAFVAALAAFWLGVSVQAQGGMNRIDSGGPLWWFPENDSSYSRHHDRWYMSTVEAVDDDWRIATSFPTVDLDQAWVSTVSLAPPNSACDVQNELNPADPNAGYMNVGPPHDDTTVVVVRTPRTPPEMGFAGLQMSLHVGEWWQGIRYRGYYDNPATRLLHFAPGSPSSSYDPDIFGWFDVGMRDGSGTVRRPPINSAGVVSLIPLGAVQWRLSGGGRLHMPCVGIAMVQMHGHRGGGMGGTAPTAPTDSNGAECWSHARPMVIRANSEVRCEPDLTQRYSYTDRFYLLLDAAPSLSFPSWLGGGNYTARVPSDYHGALSCPSFGGFTFYDCDQRRRDRRANRYLNFVGPHLFVRRGEVAVFNAAELAQSSDPPIPWTTPYTAAGRGTHSGRGAAYIEDRFDGMLDPFGGAAFGGGTMELPLRDELDPLARECIEMGEAGWIASTGTLAVDCAHGRENAPLTGNVNRVTGSGMAVERQREAGPMDNSSGFGAAVTAGRPASPPWPAPAGFEWFEHSSASLGCLFLESDVHPGFRFPAVIGENVADEARLWWEEEHNLVAAEYPLQILRVLSCGANPFCFATEIAALQFLRNRGRESLRNAYGWRIIRGYRNAVYHEMVDAFSGAFPYGYAAPRGSFVANGRVLGHGGNACVTGPGGGVGYVEAVIPSVGHAAYERSGAGTVRVTNTGDRGSAGSWFGTMYDARGAHAEGDRGAPIEKHPDPVGRTTPFSEAALPAGVSYPDELTRHPDYNNVRMGSAVWREFACGTAHDGFYGGGLTVMGPVTSNPRSFLDDGVMDSSRIDDWWRVGDAEVDLTDPRLRYSSGTPCVGDPDYDVLGADGTPRCYEQFPLAPGLNTPIAGDQFVGGIGSYSIPSAGQVGTGRYVVEYSGDGGSDAGMPGSDWPMTSTPYRLIDGSELLDLNLRTSFFSFHLGYRSLDVERGSIWWGYGSWSTPGRGSSWLTTGEGYEGIPPGGCAVGGCDSSNMPLDYGRLTHQGPLSWYGGIVPGGTGGCLLAVDRAGPVLPGENPQGTVLEENQRILCLLPVNAFPEGACPGEAIP